MKPSLPLQQFLKPANCFSLSMSGNECRRYCVVLFEDSCNFTSCASIVTSSQRGIQPSDIVDAVSKGRVTYSSKQNLSFQTTVRACLLPFDLVILIDRSSAQEGLRVVTDSQCKVR